MIKGHFFRQLTNLNNQKCFNSTYVNKHAMQAGKLWQNGEPLLVDRDKQILNIFIKQKAFKFFGSIIWNVCIVAKNT